jgi:hypothetical protein
MPNWCSNWIEITGSKESIQKIKETMETIEKSDEPNLFMTLVGVPDGVDYENDWYDTNINNWGTKWDVTLNECNIDFTDESITMGPETAWAPPINFCKSLAKKYGVEVIITYEESGCDFCGRTTIDSEGNSSEEDYLYIEGKYVFDNESFWCELESYIDSYLDYETPTYEDFIEDYDFVSDKDKERIKTMYDEAAANKNK